MPTPKPTLSEALDAIYADVRAKIGDEDLAHIRNVAAYSKAIESRGLELIASGRSRQAIARGVLLRAMHIVLEFSELGHNIMHGGFDHLPNAGRYHSERFRWALVADPEQWKVMHHLNHHPKTGIVGQDHDMGFSTARMFPSQDWYVHHALQPLVFLAFLFASPAAFSAYTASSAVRVHNEKVWRRETFAKPRAHLSRMLRRELLTSPLRAGARAPLTALANTLSQLLGYDLTGFLLIVEHHAPNVIVFADPGPDETRDAYIERQLRGTTNFTPYLPLEELCRRVLEEEVSFADRPPFEVFYGGLDTHVEHHLFPDLPCGRQREVRPRVRRVCEEHGVPYNTMPIAESLPASLMRLFPNLPPLGEGERMSELLRRPLRTVARVLDGARYRNENPARYLRRPRFFDASALVIAVERCADAVVIQMERPRGWEDLRWSPGAFVSLRVDVRGEELVRQYSLLSAEPGAPLEIAVRCVAGGRVSGQLNESVREGDRLTIVAPPSDHGGLVQESLPSRALYLAGGVGITPILSMIRRQAARPRGAHRATLLYFNRSRTSALFTETLRSLAERADLVVHEFYSDEGALRLSAALLSTHLDASTEVFACAPDGFLRAVETIAGELGIQEERVHLEQFSAPDLARRPLTGRVHRVRFALSKREVEVDEATTLLEAARDAGLAPPAGCERGLCRACACTKVSGVTEMGGAVDDVRGRVTICNSFPRGAVELEL